MFEERSTDAFREGNNCAQSVLYSFQNDPRFGTSLTLMNGASLGSGVAGSGCMCGVLSGSIMLINAYASTLGLESGATQKLAEELTTTLLNKFKADYGSTCCRVIKRNQNLDSREARSGCTDMVGDITIFVDALINEHRASAVQQPATRIAPIDIPAIGRRIAQGLLAGLGIGVGVGALIAVFSEIPSWWPLVGLALGAALAFATSRGRRSLRIARTALLVALGFSVVVGGVILFAGIDSLAVSRLVAAYSHSLGAISLGAAFVSALTLFGVRVFESIRFGL